MNGAVITALNEAATIGELVAALKSLGLAVIVIDDGSTDNTSAAAMAGGAEVVRNNENKGIARSLMTAWAIALSRGWDYTIQIDAGGSHNPQDIQSIALHHRPDILIGSRFRPTSEYIGRQWRAYLSNVTAHICGFIACHKITDWTSGYRVFSRKALQVLSKQNYLATGHAWQIEVLFYALENKLSVSEFPITYRAGNSTLKWKTVDELIKVLLWMVNK